MCLLFLCLEYLHHVHPCPRVYDQLATCQPTESHSTAEWEKQVALYTAAETYETFLYEFPFSIHSELY
jgi:hypothetical protein